MSGYYEQHKDYLGNVKTDGLQSLLQGSKYLCEVCRIVKNVAEHDEKCGKCLYFKYCAGGCRAIALALTGDKLAADPSKCLFFGKGYYNKTVEAMEGWTNRSEINIINGGIDFEVTINKKKFSAVIANDTCFSLRLFKK